MSNKDKIILDLCGGTGSWSKPHKDAGYTVVLITLKNSTNGGKPLSIWAKKDLEKFDMLKSKDIHSEYFGSLDRQARRSITPAGFARAFFEANQ